MFFGLWDIVLRLKLIQIFNIKTHTANHKKVNLAHLVERLSDKQNVIGSIPIVYLRVS